MIVEVRRKELEKIGWKENFLNEIYKSDKYIYFEEVEKNNWCFYSWFSQLTIMDLLYIDDWKPVNLSEKEVFVIKTIGKKLME